MNFVSLLLANLSTYPTNGKIGKMLDFFGWWPSPKGSFI